MRNALRIAGQFNDEVAGRFGVSGLEHAIIIDDNANLLHLVQIEYAVKEDQLYRRLSYKMIAMQTMKAIGEWENDTAQQLLNKIALELSGSTLSYGRNFQKNMLILPGDESWDDELPTDDKKPAKKRKPASKKSEERTPAPASEDLRGAA